MVPSASFPDATNGEEIDYDLIDEFFYSYAVIENATGGLDKSCEDEDVAIYELYDEGPELSDSEGTVTRTQTTGDATELNSPTDDPVNNYIFDETSIQAVISALQSILSKQELGVDDGDGEMPCNKMETRQIMAPGDETCPFRAVPSTPPTADGRMTFGAVSRPSCAT
ncbi:hypothetical protein MD484_g3086, partial [Candolleomyces efflorescens]